MILKLFKYLEGNSTNLFIAGVITKLDIMDKGTDASNILKNSVTENNQNFIVLIKEVFIL